MLYDFFFFFFFFFFLGRFDKRMRKSNGIDHPDETESKIIFFAWEPLCAGGFSQ
jgi:hypothetical protein